MDDNVIVRRTPLASAWSNRAMVPKTLDCQMSARFVRPKSYAE